MGKKLGKLSISNWRSLLILLALISAFSVQAYDENRPKIGLVLSGGGARGLAHIGVLRELENNSQYEEASNVLDLVRSIDGLIEEVKQIEEDQTTDEIYVLDVQKRQLGKSIQKIFGSSPN